MLRVLCTSAAFRFRLAPTLFFEGLAGPATAAARPMAVPASESGPSRSALLLATAALAISLTGLWRQDSVVSMTRVALDGLTATGVLAEVVDPADRPAMDPALAWVFDPRALAAPDAAPLPRNAPVQPFEYVAKPGERAEDIAARFGTDVSALLWNNGLASVDELEAGARLTILPVRGVLHLVKAGETLNMIAARYGSRVEDLVVANAIEVPELIFPDQVIVVAGGVVPMPKLDIQPAEALAMAAAEPIVVPTVASVPPKPAVEERLPSPPNASGWQKEFILSVAPGARKSQRENGVPASVTLAQAILESDWGRSKLTVEAKNLFGIKALRGPGTAGIYNIKTWEVISGQDVTVMAAFKAYTTLADSIVDHGRWFHDNPRYHKALAVKNDPREFARAINAAGYATDPAYAPKLIALMDKYNLYAYDVDGND